MTLKPINQTNLYGLDNIFNELNNLFSDNKLPNKILFSGKKGIGKSTLSYHLINCILSKDEEFSYDTTNHTINRENKSFKLIQNGSNPNFNLIDVSSDKKMIEINQIRNLINKINKSSFNDKPRFILIDNIEYLNINSANALLKSLEEPNQNIFFILINNQKKILPTIKSRCLNFNISLTYNDTISIIDNILGENVLDIVNNELLNYYFSPGNIYNLIQFSKIEDIDSKNISLKNLLKTVIKKNLYKNDTDTKFLIYELVELFLHKISLYNYDYYNYFLKRLKYMSEFNLDEESFFIEFESKILNA